MMAFLREMVVVRQVNRTREEHRDPADVVQKFTNFRYDDYNRLQYAYFTSTVPEGPGSVFFKYGYFDVERDGPEELVDHLPNHDMGWRLRTVSPDTGTTIFGYDPAGNLTSAVNANGITMNRAYDALDRPTTVTYPDTSLNVAQSYDSLAVTFGIGRRTGMTDPSGSTVYHYDRRGLPRREEKTIGSRMYVTGYGHDKTGNLKQILYPTDDAATRPVLQLICVVLGSILLLANCAEAPGETIRATLIGKYELVVEQGQMISRTDFNGGALDLRKDGAFRLVCSFEGRDAEEVRGEWDYCDGRVHFTSFRDCAGVWPDFDNGGSSLGAHLIVESTKPPLLVLSPDANVYFRQLEE